MGFEYPLDIQRRAVPVLLSGADAVIRSQTGSGKTIAYLAPVLSRLDYPPKLDPAMLPGPQVIILAPTAELGVQLALLLYRLYGGSTVTGVPGDRANMYTYTGPR